MHISGCCCCLVAHTLYKSLLWNYKNCWALPWNSFGARTASSTVAVKKISSVFFAFCWLIWDCCFGNLKCWLFTYANCLDLKIIICLFCANWILLGQTNEVFFYVIFVQIMVFCCAFLPLLCITIFKTPLIIFLSQWAWEVLVWKRCRSSLNLFLFSQGQGGISKTLMSS